MAFIVNIVAGWLLGTVRGDVLIGVGLLGTMVRVLSLSPLPLTTSDTNSFIPILRRPPR